VSALTPIADVYVDTDNNAAFLWPSGASLSGAQLNFLISFVQSFTTPTGTLASITINGRNKDVGAHTYFVHFAVSYFPAGPTGVYR
jgi:hypothetical protein